MKPLRILEIIQRLESHHVRYVVIGGVAAAMHGSSQLTQDLDLCLDFEEENWARVLDALAGLDPRYVMTLDHRALDKSAAELAQFKNLYLATELGRVDFLGEVAPLGRYKELSPRAVTMELGGYRCSAVSIDDLITIKEFVGRPKDRLVAIELRAIRDKTRSLPPGR